MSVVLTYQLSALLLSLGLLVLGLIVFAGLSNYDHDDALTTADNPAVGWVTFGFLSGMLIVIATILSMDVDHEQQAGVMVYDLVELVIYGLTSIFLLKLSGILNDRLILGSFDNRKELIDDRNQGVGVCLLGSYIASALMISGAIYGEGQSGDPQNFWSNLGPDLLTVLGYFAVGQVMLMVFAKFYLRIVGGNVLNAIEADYEVDGRMMGGNHAAGTALGLNLIAFGIMLMGAGFTEHTDLTQMGKDYALFAALGLFVLPVWQIVVDKVMLRQADLNKEIYEDRNVNAALIEGISVIGLALLLFLIF